MLSWNSWRSACLCLPSAGSRDLVPPGLAQFIRYLLSTCCCQTLFGGWGFSRRYGMGIVLCWRVWVETYMKWTNGFQRWACVSIIWQLPGSSKASELEHHWWGKARPNLTSASVSPLPPWLPLSLSSSCAARHLQGVRTRLHIFNRKTTDKQCYALTDDYIKKKILMPSIFSYLLYIQHWWGVIMMYLIKFLMLTRLSIPRFDKYLEKW